MDSKTAIKYYGTQENIVNESLFSNLKSKESLLF